VTGDPEPGWVLTQASNADRAWLQSVGFFTEAVEASPLDKLPAEQQLVATTILDRQGKPVPSQAEADIAALAERFAQADAGMWAAVRAIAQSNEPEPAVEAAPEPAPPKPKSGWDLVTSRPGVVVEPEPKKATKPKLKLVRPEVEPAAPDMPVFTAELIARMFANLAAHGMTLQDLAG
jgi:hypothetical protein